MKRYVIYGPPGTGKTSKIVNLIKSHNIESKRVGLFSYTKTAAKELAKRSNLKSDYIGTIHSICFKLCDLIREQVIDNKKLKEFSDLSGIQFSGSNVQDSTELLDGDYYIALYGLHKSKLNNCFLETYDNSDRPGLRDDWKYFVTAYKKWKHATGYIDYHDMLKMALDSKNVLDIDLLFVDEAQDLSPLQWKLINKWSKNINTIYIAGDDDQAIFEWAGADPQGMYIFEKTHNAKRILLNQSYRVPNLIHKKANEIISNVNFRVEKEYKPKDEQGVIEHYSDIHNVEIKHGEDILILYRNHSLRKDVEEYLVSKGIPYLADNGKKGMCQGRFYKLVNLYTKILTLGADKYRLCDADHRLLKQGLHEDQQQKLGTPHMHEVLAEPWQTTLNLPIYYKNYFEELQCNRLLDKTPTIHLSTIHNAKGREAERIILINGIGEMSAEKLYDENQLEQEARVFYVAVTRAKKQLDIVHSSNSFTWLGG